MALIENLATSLTEKVALSRTQAADLGSIKKLNLWSSGLYDVSLVRKMPNLEVCSLSLNYISSLEDFSFCEKLQELFIRENKIEDLSEICHLAKLPNLHTLWLEGNPCAQQDDAYRATVLKALPNLKKFDNIVVTQEELEEAKQKGKDLSLPCDNNKIPSTQPSSLPHSFDNWKDIIRHSMEEVNKVREEHGLDPLPLNSVMPTEFPEKFDRSRNVHILQAILLLVKELDPENLRLVQNVITKRLDYQEHASF